MPEHQGKIIRVKNRFPGTPTIAMSCAGIALFGGLHLCFQCVHYKPHEAGHCPIAQAQYDFNNAHNVSGPVVRCGHFEPKFGMAVSNSGEYM